MPAKSTSRYACAVCPLLYKTKGGLTKHFASKHSKPVIAPLPLSLTAGLGTSPVWTPVNPQPMETDQESMSSSSSSSNTRHALEARIKTLEDLQSRSDKDLAHRISQLEAYVPQVQDQLSSLNRACADIQDRMNHFISKSEFDALRDGILARQDNTESNMVDTFSILRSQEKDQNDRLYTHRSEMIDYVDQEVQTMQQRLIEEANEKLIGVVGNQLQLEGLVNHAEIGLKELETQCSVWMQKVDSNLPKHCFELFLEDIRARELGPLVWRIKMLEKKLDTSCSSLEEQSVELSQLVHSALSEASALKFQVKVSLEKEDGGGNERCSSPDSVVGVVTLNRTQVDMLHGE